VSRNGALLSIRGLERRFGEREVVRKLDLSLGPGERVALWGPNGSGKTTVLRCVAGTLAPSGGEIRVGEHPAGELEARRLIGSSLSQERSFYLRLSGHANLLFFARVRFGDEAEAVRRVAAVEEELDLGAFASQRVDRCSTGMIQQLGLGRALLGDPALLLLDEPTKSLDADARERLWGALERRPGTAVLMATHLEEDLARCGKRVQLPV
jgi:ABC-type multidrug transport system ATPase subunit